MGALVETINSISSVMDGLIDFSVCNEYLSKDFENFLIKNEIDIERQSEVQNCLIEYILDEKTEENVRVLDYFIQKNPSLSSSDKKIIDALKNSFISIFQVKKILKNAYRAFCLSNEKEFELIPLVKMTNLRGVGLYDYIKARMIEIDGVFYLLEIFDCFGEFRENIANLETIRCLIKYPESQTMYNDEKLLELKESTKVFNEKFKSIFTKDEIITSNTLADEFIKDFNSFIENGEKPDGKKYDEEYPTGFFRLDEDSEDFIKNATGGFSDSSVPYDIGFFMDKDSGLYIIPFLGTFNEILKSGSLDEIEHSKECVQYILNSDKVSVNLLIKKEKEFKDFIKIVNSAFDKEFKDIREIIGYFKGDWLLNSRFSGKFSPTMALYNSKTFEKMINIKDDMIKSN